MYDLGDPRIKPMKRDINGFAIYRDKSSGRVVRHNCDWCGKTGWAVKADLLKNKNAYCTRNCKWFSLSWIDSPEELNKILNEPSYIIDIKDKIIGNSFITGHGQMRVTIPCSHPLGANKSTYYRDRKSNSHTIPVHRLFMSAKIRRWLKSSEQVHHKDGNHLNNDLDNLELRNGNHGTGSTHKRIKLPNKKDEYITWEEWELLRRYRKNKTKFLVVI